MSTSKIIYLLCKHKQIRTLITSLVLQKIKDVEASSNETNSECKFVAYIGIIVTILSLIIVSFLHYRKPRFCKGYKFSTVVKIMMFISDCKSMYQLNYARQEVVFTYSKLEAH